MKDQKRFIADIFLKPLYLIIIHLMNINIDSVLLIAQLSLGNIRSITVVLLLLSISRSKRSLIESISFVSSVFAESKYMNRRAIQIMMQSNHAPSAQFMTAPLSDHQ